MSIHLIRAMKMLSRMLPQQNHYPHACFLILPVIGFVLSLFALKAHAEIVTLNLSDKMAISAEYKQGAKDRPAILMMHGFLQTREFAIVKSMADELANAGYTVLSPSLSLGITQRKKSLDCEALHLHSMEGDIKEIQHWVEWLHGKGHKKIVGLGHSFGSTQLLAWMDKYPHDDFRLIAVSLVGSIPQVQRNKPAPASERKRGAALLIAPLSFCNRYAAPASNYFSYLDWNEKKILSALGTTKAPLDVILGSDDNRLAPGWENQLKQAGINTHVIKGANHFMDGTHEFDVLEIALGILKK